MRGVAFFISVPNPDPISGQSIYINQFEYFTILGGPICFDQGEQWSQATVTYPSPPSTGPTPPPHSRLRKATTPLCGAPWGGLETKDAILRTQSTTRVPTAISSTLINTTSATSYPKDIHKPYRRARRPKGRLPHHHRRISN